METLSYPKKVKANKIHKCNFCSFEISKGVEYMRSSHKFDEELYTWKSHINCSELINKIALDFGDGVTGDDFEEYVKSEYQTIMSNNYNEIYESKDFKYPNFESQLKFVLDFHKISF